MPKLPDKKFIVAETAKFIEKEFDNESTGHDWYHIYRVWQMAKIIAAKEKADMFVVELGALLHDIADWKEHDDEKTGGRATREWLQKFDLDKKTIDHVCHIVDNVSFKGIGSENKIKTLEGKVVQDADRLDAIGAIAIARVFAFGGSKGRPIHNPKVPFDPLSEAEYRIPKNHSKTSRPSLHHFYDKLLHLKDLINTKTAKKMAVRRHKIMEEYLEEFFSEWGIKADDQDNP